MHCPCCGSPDLRVLTGTPERDWRLRLRRCSSCSTKIKTIEIPADQVVAFHQPLVRTKHRGSRLAVIATRVGLVRTLLQHLASAEAPSPERRAKPPQGSVRLPAGRRPAVGRSEA